MAEVSVGRATSDEVAYFARRRTQNEHDYRLYVDLAHVAPNGVFVARDEGTAVGIAIAHALEDEWQLSEIFLEPTFRGQGIGLELLKAAAEGAGDVNRSGVVDPDEPDGLRFYVRQGVPLCAPLVEISGEIPRATELERMAAGEYRFGADPIDPHAQAMALSQLDREVRASARPADHLYFADHATGFIFTRENELAGYAYVWPSGRIGPLASVSQTYLVQILAYALAAARASYGAEWCTMLVPGVNVRILRACMRALLKVTDVRLFASDALSATTLNLERYIAFHSLLF